MSKNQKKSVNLNKIYNNPITEKEAVKVASQIEGGEVKKSDSGEYYISFAGGANAVYRNPQTRKLTFGNCSQFKK
ncbi:MAG: hypothetical protein LBD11_06640 [Candidatus Peribacteria bacterium]|jgi:hypothetical protein|nr:hypothetical protein [Candidatus Peribacteria bacterium]